MSEELQALTEQSNSLPVERAPMGGTAHGTAYVTCPDYPGLCSHPKGECPADRRAAETGTASFKRIG